MCAMDNSYPAVLLGNCPQIDNPNVSRSQTKRNTCYEGILHISANSINRRPRRINHHSSTAWQKFITSNQVPCVMIYRVDSHKRPSANR